MPDDKLGAMSAPPKKKTPAKPAPKAKAKATLTPHTGDAHDKAVAKVVQPLADTYLNYVQSPEYLDRLKGMQVPNAERVQADRVAQLGKLRVASVAKESENLDTYGGAPILSANRASSRYTLMHEIGHTLNEGGEYAKSMGATPFTASANGMSPVEGWKFINAAKGLDPRLKAMAHNAYQGEGEQGFYSSDPTLKVKPEGMDEHGVSTREMKSDLDALRLMLLDKGITTKFGEKLDADKMKRLLEQKDLQGEEHLQRLLRNFSPEALIKLNNEIAATKNAGSNIA
jgi:hypothetical protein